MFVLLATIYLWLLYSHGSTGFYYPDCEYSGLSCLDCSTQKMCLNVWGLVHWSNTPCANDVVGYSNPYCNPETDKCTNVRPEGCPTQTFFQCQRDGVFPDTSDCKMYYRCTNLIPESYHCPTNFVYKQELGKCVFKLTNDDCFEVGSCGLLDYVEQYPGDPSLYYGCQTSSFYFGACSGAEVYNAVTETCESICNDVGRIPIPQDCTKYYSCEATAEYGLAAIEESCPEGYGFNSISLSCEDGFSTLCNELAIFENNKYDFISKIPIIGKFTNTIRKVLNLFRLNPAKLLFIFRLSDEDISSVILISDYIYQNKRLPPTSITVLVNYVIDKLPSQLQFIFDILSQFGIIQRTLSTRLTRSVHTDLSVQDYLEDALSNAEIDVIALTENFVTKNTSEINASIVRHIFEIFKIPEDKISLVVDSLKEHIPDIVDLLNEYIGESLFKDEGNGALNVDVNVLDRAIDDILKLVASRLYGNNLFQTKIFTIIAKQQYYLHHKEIVQFLSSFYINFTSA